MCYAADEDEYFGAPDQNRYFGAPDEDEYYPEVISYSPQMMRNSCGDGITFACNEEEFENQGAIFEKVDCEKFEEKVFQERAII